MTPHEVLNFFAACLCGAFIGGVVFIASLIMRMFSGGDNNDDRA
jgi:hypothetical protein